MVRLGGCSWHGAETVGARATDRPGGAMQGLHGAPGCVAWRPVAYPARRMSITQLVSQAGGPGRSVSAKA